MRASLVRAGLMAPAGTITEAPLQARPAERALRQGQVQVQALKPVRSRRPVGPVALPLLLPLPRPARVGRRPLHLLVRPGATGRGLGNRFQGRGFVGHGHSLGGRRALTRTCQRLMPDSSLVRRARSCSASAVRALRCASASFWFRSTNDWAAFSGLSSGEAAGSWTCVVRAAELTLTGVPGVGAISPGMAGGGKFAGLAEGSAAGAFVSSGAMGGGALAGTCSALDGAGAGSAGGGCGAWAPFWAHVVLAIQLTIPSQPSSAAIPTRRTIRAGVIITPSSNDVSRCIPGERTRCSRIAGQFIKPRSTDPMGILKFLIFREIRARIVAPAQALPLEKSRPITPQ